MGDYFNSKLISSKTLVEKLFIVNTNFGYPLLLKSCPTI